MNWPDFEVYQIGFTDREAFENALLIGARPDDIGYADWIFTYFNREDRDRDHRHLKAHGVHCGARDR